MLLKMDACVCVCVCAHLQNLIEQAEHVVRRIEQQKAAWSWNKAKCRHRETRTANANRVNFGSIPFSIVGFTFLVCNTLFTLGLTSLFAQFPSSNDRTRSKRYFKHFATWLGASLHSFALMPSLCCLQLLHDSLRVCKLPSTFDQLLSQCFAFVDHHWCWHHRCWQSAVLLWSQSIDTIAFEFGFSLLGHSRCALHPEFVAFKNDQIKRLTDGSLNGNAVGARLSFQHSWRSFFTCPLVQFRLDMSAFRLNPTESVRQVIRLTHSRYPSPNQSPKLLSFHSARRRWWRRSAPLLLTDADC